MTSGPVTQRTYDLTVISGAPGVTANDPQIPECDGRVRPDAYMSATSAAASCPALGIPGTQPTAFALPTVSAALNALRSAIWLTEPHSQTASRTVAPAPSNSPSRQNKPSPTPRPRSGGSPTVTHSKPALPTRVTVPQLREQNAAEPGNGPHDDGPDPIWDAVHRAQNGDAEAFGEIYDRYADTVYRYIYFRVSSRPLAEDLTSEAFLRALRRIGSVTWQGRDLGAWLVTIARNLIADHYKSGRYRLEISTADMLDEDREDASYGGKPEAEVMERINNEALLIAVKKLNAEQQECIVLRFLQGMSVAETAQIMNKNDGAIKALQYRAVRSLGRLLPDGFAR